MMDWILANLVVLFFVFLKKLKGESEEIERSSISESAEGTFLFFMKNKKRRVEIKKQRRR